jgi:transcriptional regulator with XRE-family HTH domain
MSTGKYKKMQNNYTGTEIKRIRNLIGLSQRAFAKQIGRDYYLICRYESGKANPSKETLKLIVELAKIFNIDVDLNKLLGL